MNNTDSINLLSTATGPIRYGLTNDYMFHAVFQESPEALKHLLAALLNINYKDILSCELLNPIILGDNIDDKNSILDIRLLLNSGSLINLEMQNANFANWPSRSLYYLCKLYCNIKKGENYNQIKPSIHIGILTSSPFPETQEFYSEYLMMNPKTKHIFSSNFSLRMLNLGQLDNVPEKERDTQLYYWAKLFTATTWEEIKMLTEKNNGITEAASYMRQLSEEEKIQLQCEARERYYMDISSERDAGIQQGIQQGVELICQLNQSLIADKRMDDLIHAVSDSDFQNQLLKEYGLVK
jgi:predicted transposase/invertase (TIGR01784 family)